MTPSQIFQIIGIENSDDNFKAEILGKIVATAGIRFSRAVDDILSEEDKQRFARETLGKNPQEVVDWLVGNFDGIDEVYEASVKVVVAEIKDKMLIPDGD